jgi:hypothetical protein
MKKAVEIPLKSGGIKQGYALGCYRVEKCYNPVKTGNCIFGGRLHGHNPFNPSCEESEFCNCPMNVCLLSESEIDILFKWIRENMDQGNKESISSYGLKHIFENSEDGFYLLNGAFKGAMLIMGFEPINKNDINWSFKISVINGNNKKNLI